MKKRLVALLTAAVLVLAALPAALADGQIRILPVDMSGGAPYKETFRDNPAFFEDPDFREDLFNSDFNRYPNAKKVFRYEDPTICTDLYSTRITHSDEFGKVY